MSYYLFSLFFLFLRVLYYRAVPFGSFAVMNLDTKLYEHASSNDFYTCS